MMSKADQIFEELIRPIESRMIKIVWRIVLDPEEAEDVFQDILAQIWAKLVVILRHPTPHAYILRICVTKSYDALRRRSRRQRYEVFLETIKSQLLPVYPNELMGAFDQKSAMRAAIALLPRKQGQAILLRVMDDAPYASIGAVLGCSEETARSHFSKGKARLKKILARMGVLVR
ncbi:MAG: RNA polymerase sigma factor [Desulfobacteraceae bacterium]|nr:RNA polymerase sigma factor [Desulfobacteraceae bacterium]